MATESGGSLSHGLGEIVLGNTALTWMVALALAAGGQFLDLPARPTRLLNFLPSFALIYQGAAWGSWAIRYWLERQLKSARPAVRSC